MVGCSCAVCPVSTVLCRCQAPRRHPPPGWFGRRGCKLLKIKNGRSKKRVKRDQRGCKLMKIREMPQSQRENGRNEEGQRGTRVCVATGLDASPILPGEEERRMANFLEYNPEQAYLLPPTVREVLGGGHLCFFVHGAVEKLDLRELEAGYSEEGHPAYHPALLLKVWLYAYALGMTSSRRLEQRIREDLAFRYLAGGAQPDFWAWNAPRSARTFGGGSNSARAKIRMKEPGWRWRARRWRSSKDSFVRFPCGCSG